MQKTVLHVQTQPIITEKIYDSNSEKEDEEDRDTVADLDYDPLEKVSLFPLSYSTIKMNNLQR